MQRSALALGSAFSCGIYRYVALLSRRCRRFGAAVLSVKAPLPDSCWVAAPYLPSSSRSSPRPPAETVAACACRFARRRRILLGRFRARLVFRPSFPLTALRRPPASLCARPVGLAPLRATEAARETPGFTPKIPAPKFLPVSFQRNPPPSFTSLFSRQSPAV